MGHGGISLTIASSSSPWRPATIGDASDAPDVRWPTPRSPRSPTADRPSATPRRSPRRPAAAPRRAAAAISGSDRGRFARAIEELDDVHLLDRVFEALALDPVGQHRHAERARARDGLGARIEELERALDVHAVGVLLLHPHLRAAGAAAEAALLGPVLGLDELHARDALQDLARRVVHAVVAAEVARVVVDDAPLRRAWSARACPRPRGRGGSPCGARPRP